MENVSLWMAFAAGLVSFLSPCVLPLVPGYISYLSGVSVPQMLAAAEGQKLSLKSRYRILLAAVLFVSGFTLVFVLLGATATEIGALLSTKISLLTKIAGSMIILFGLIKLGVLRWLFLMKERRFQTTVHRWGILSAPLLGAAFAFGWTPCVGPILGAILMFAGTMEGAQTGVALLTTYAMGLGIPFLLMAIGIGRFMRWFRRMKRYVGVIEKIAGAMMVILGLMMITDTLVKIPGYLSFLNRLVL